jgi:antitoxin component of MazEF toxin-antitoxin module
MDKPIFDKTIRSQGDSLVMSIPTELVRYLELTEGTKVELIADVSKHGRYIGIWNPTQQKAKA